MVAMLKLVAGVEVLTVAVSHNRATPLMSRATTHANVLATPLRYVGPRVKAESFRLIGLHLNEIYFDGYVEPAIIVVSGNIPGITVHHMPPHVSLNNMAAAGS